MNAPVRFAYANARLHALKTDLWDEAQRSRVQAAPALCVPPPSDELADLFPPLVRWYATLLGACPPAERSVLALLRRHEIENLKLLWRGAVRGRTLPPRCWRPLGSLGTIDPALASQSLDELVDRLKTTPYARLAADTWRSHGVDLAAAELAFDGWVATELYEAARALPRRESPARNLLYALIRERDFDLLARGRDAYRLEPAFVVGLTTLLKRECGRDVLLALAAWLPSNGALADLLPDSLARVVGVPHDWDDVKRAIRRVRMAECRRALMMYPFQIAPTLAAVFLREEQMQFVARLAVHPVEDRAAAASCAGPVEPARAA